MAKKREHLRPKTPEAAFAEARRLYQNALAHLARAPRGERMYLDAKPVREACAVGYVAALLAIDGALLARGVDPKKLPDSYEDYEASLRRLVPRNGKLREALIITYDNLHLFGYYRGGVGIQMIKEGLDCARFLIDALAA